MLITEHQHGFVPKKSSSYDSIFTSSGGLGRGTG